MTIITYTVWIALWLLSGFLAAWLGHIIDNHSYPQNTSYREVFWLSVGGGFTLILLVLGVLFQSDIMKRPLFKAKEPK